mgnify:CR=1 FL=1
MLREKRPEAVVGAYGMAVARALINEPQLVAADEPTGDLDPDMTKTVFSLLRDAAANGAAVLLVTHEENAAEYADRVYKMEKGVLSAVF